MCSVGDYGVYVFEGVDATIAQVFGFEGGKVLGFLVKVV
jgi:hypothetical protein